MRSAARPPVAGPAALPWAEIVRWTVMGLLGVLLLVAMDVSRNGGNNLLSLVQPGTDGPSAAVIAQDFPTVEPPDGLGLDGQQYYAIARDPLHLDVTAAQLDRPRYRLQRPLLPWLGWALHPTGGGMGLVVALAVVGLAGLAVGALATGALSTMWGGPAWLAALFPLLPGAYWSLRVTVSDSLALALALLAVALAARQRTAWAVAAGVLAVLAKEPAILILAGWALYRRTKRDALVAVVPAAAIVAWMGWLALQLPADPPSASVNADMGWPLVGLVRAWGDVWSEGRELVGMACILGGLAIGIVALAKRGLRHPLGCAIALQLGFLLIMGVNPTAMNFGATRMAMPVMILAALALATPRAPAGPEPDEASAEASEPHEGSEAGTDADVAADGPEADAVAPVGARTHLAAP